MQTRVFLVVLGMVLGAVAFAGIVAADEYCTNQVKERSYDNIFSLRSETAWCYDGTEITAVSMETSMTPTWIGILAGWHLSGPTVSTVGGVGDWDHEEVWRVTARRWHNQQVVETRNYSLSKSQNAVGQSW